MRPEQRGKEERGWFVYSQNKPFNPFEYGRCSYFRRFSRLQRKEECQQTRYPATGDRYPGQFGGADAFSGGLEKSLFRNVNWGDGWEQQTGKPLPERKHSTRTQAIL